MPIFDFACRACGRQFETLVRSGDTPACECGSQDLKQLFSGFAVSSAGIRKASVAKARKNAEKARADRRQTEHQHMQQHMKDEH